MFIFSPGTCHDTDSALYGIRAEADHRASVTAEGQRIERQQQWSAYLGLLRQIVCLGELFGDSVEASKLFALVTGEPFATPAPGLQFPAVLFERAAIGFVAGGGRDALGIADVVRIGVNQRALFGAGQIGPPVGIVTRPRAGRLHQPQRVAELFGSLDRAAPVAPAPSLPPCFAERHRASARREHCRYWTSRRHR